jgi:hypothetical protein
MLPCIPPPPPADSVPALSVPAYAEKQGSTLLEVGRETLCPGKWEVPPADKS